MSALTGQCCCTVCGLVSVFKCARADFSQSTRAVIANEIIVTRLLAKLAARYAGVRYCAAYLEEVAPYGLSAVIDKITAIGRVGSADHIGIWPRWLYDFDRWIGRLDGPGDSNSLLMADNTVISIDWALSFTWAAIVPKLPDPAYYLIRHIDDLDVPYHPLAFAARDLHVRSAIRMITEDDLWDALCVPGYARRIYAVSITDSIFYRVSSSA